LRLFWTRLGMYGLLTALAACGSDERLPSDFMQMGPQVVDASSAPNIPLSASFKRLTTVKNPCGAFGGGMAFGVNSDLLDLSCRPDTRTAISNGFNGQFGVVSPSTSTPWRVSINLADSRELDRLDSFTPCSKRLDAFELSLGNGEAFFRCTPNLDTLELGWRLLTKGQDQQPIELFIPNTYEYEYFWIDKLLVRQSKSRHSSEPIPVPEISAPSSKPIWRSWQLESDPKACGTVLQETPDQRRLIAFVGMTGPDPESGDATYLRCLNEKLAFVSPEQKGPFAKFQPWSPGMVSHTVYNGRLLEVDPINSLWSTKYPVANIKSPDGVEVSFLTGDGIAPWRYSGVSVIEGHGLIALEVAPRFRLGSRPFLYLVFNWDGEPLARFYATRLALAPDRPRIVVTSGNAIETWDLK